MSEGTPSAGERPSNTSSDNDTETGTAQSSGGGKNARKKAARRRADGKPMPAFNDAPEAVDNDDVPNIPDVGADEGVKADEVKTGKNGEKYDHPVIDCIPSELDVGIARSVLNSLPTMVYGIPKEVAEGIGLDAGKQTVTVMERDPSGKIVDKDVSIAYAVAKYAKAMSGGAGTRVEELMRKYPILSSAVLAVFTVYQWNKTVATMAEKIAQAVAEHQASQQKANSTGEPLRVPTRVFTVSSS